MSRVRNPLRQTRKHPEGHQIASESEPHLAKVRRVVRAPRPLNHGMDRPFRFPQSVGETKTAPALDLRVLNSSRREMFREVAFECAGRWNAGQECNCDVETEPKRHD